MSRLLLAALGGPLAALAVGCASALGEPPDLAGLGGGARQPAAAAPEQVTSWLAEAEGELEAAREPVAVAQARRLFLDAVAADPDRLEGFLGAARATAWLIEHEEAGGRREELATEGVQIGQLCRRHHPDAPECTYRLALAVGQQARERPATATDGLKVMVDLLEEVIASAPDLDHAGGHRVLALVLLRAPGWPTGPGDPELGLEHARAAAEAFPDHPPNQLVLGEALLENDLRVEARGALERGVALARSSNDPEAAEWSAEGEAALAELR